ncbi:DUF5107 domain-containing protein [Flavisolibacter nicotianae]|uniref:DUF5107 domain-containing protein n=1 Tax=Flavisolibacter nicotianae TaxID=2364882 RepID=UPI000EACB185|nr:DUF5107 domain-containing protein [Flavisolibacter nicotianae]
MDKFSVNIWKEQVIIPTYETGLPEKNPMFFEKRVYQGSSGAVYPLPIIEKIFDEKKDKAYEAVFLENRYLKIMVLPQLGGRIQMAYDKIANRHFIYYNEVIKPALVGLCGPWISGGIEFNWPQHHRPSTFEPVDFSLEENEDGSKTIWINEIDKMYGTRGTAGFTLYPDRAYLEIKARLFNRTPLPQTFLWWANPAVHVNEHYQSIFPPDVNAVFDHGRRDVSEFPIAKGVYYKVDYAPGTDISRYQNIPVPTSYMAVNSVYDFVGGYEHDTQGGLVHVANHHISPGKKQWTWGNGEFGKAWDRNLTDENGPYIELMTGVFTDNQPDFSWLMPYEEKTFTQYFLPYRELGVLKNASKDLLLHFSICEGKACLKLFATSALHDLSIDVQCKGETFPFFVTELTPEQVFTTSFNVPASATEEDVNIRVLSAAKTELLAYPEKGHQATPPVPEPAKAPATPEETETIEALYLTGLHLEQYRHATFNPVDYYEEGLRRDAGDSRCNNALGLLLLRRGKIAESETYFRRAIDTLTRLNPNPADSEPYYHLGLCLQLQHKFDEAYDAFYKATWSGACQSNSFFALAQIDLAQHRYDQALTHLRRALKGNAGNAKAVALEAAALRKLNRVEEALALCAEGLQNDVFHLSLYFEKSLLHRMSGHPQLADEVLEKAWLVSRGDVQNFLEYALDYAAAGLYEEAIQWLQYLIAQSDTPNPLPLYYTGWCEHLLGREAEATDAFAKAAALGPDYCFPNRIREIAILQTALQYNPSDAKASYYLGCLWFDKKQYAEAIACWQKAADLDADLPAVYRNLGIACFNKLSDPQQARKFFEKAFQLHQNDGRILMELDQLYKRLNRLPQERLDFLEAHLDLVESRDDLFLERAALYNHLGKYEMAFQLIMGRQFHPWEGGEGKVSAQYKYSLLQMAREALGKKEFEQALDFLQKAQHYPANLGEGKLYGTPENEIFYWMGCAYEGLKQKALAADCFQKAAQGNATPVAAIFYNDPQPDTIFYQGLALEKMGKAEEAKAVFQRLVNYGKTHLDDTVKIDFFAVSLPDLLVFDDDLGKRNKVHCIYMMALGFLGLGNEPFARSLFEEIALLDAMHTGAKTHAGLLRFFVEAKPVSTLK